ncbi:hypothetical protein IFM89_011762 [Coptis chinensis]|uniref:SAM-dependent MTase RsmB/NOP-type domain-containing protein n=1 Tax=Coptis chinensis TaxID=261450 RepID=A0A835IN72_9MAGN|nr:hypothetical protein IFM89_011762 [Coptis chinensis]
MKKGGGRPFFKTIRTLFSTLHNQTNKPKMDERYSYNPKLKWNSKVEEYFIKAYGVDHFSKISKALARPSCYSCIRVNTLKSTSDAVIEKLLEIELRSAVLGYGQDNLITKCQIPGLDYVLFVKGSGPHTITYGDAASTPPKEVLVSRKCAEAVLRGAQVFVPGVLACSAHVEIGDRVSVSVAVEQPGSENKWGVGITRGTILQGTLTGKKYNVALRTDIAFNMPDPYYSERSGLYIGQGTTHMSRAGMFRASEGIAVEMTERVFDLPSFHSLLEGEIFLQNLPSIITAHVLDPQQGERILDMCAAPGGKTTAIAILMRDKGEIIAMDRSHNKVLDIKKLAAEMGISCITPYRLDALKSVCQNNESIEFATQHCVKEPVGAKCDCTGLCESPNGDMTSIATKKCQPDVGNEGGGKYLSKAETRKNIRRLKNGPGRSHSVGGRVEKEKGFFPGSFDRVLLDAPCSALGLRPRLFAGEESVESLRKHGKYQRKMFDQAVQLVRPGGIIVYSTCTINPGENEALVRYALDTYKFLSLAPQNPRIGGPGLVGHCELFDGEITEEWLRPGEEELVQRFDPSSSLDTIGFFIAKFKVAQKDS